MKKNLIFIIYILLYSCTNPHTKKSERNDFEGLYQIKSYECNKVLNVNPFDCLDGSNVVLYENKNLPTQHWKLIPADEENYYFIVLNNYNKALAYYCLPNLCEKEEQKVHIFDFNKTKNQKWKIVPADSKKNTYYIYTFSGKLLLDVYAPNGFWCQDNNNIQLYRYKGGFNQQWEFYKIN
jgi:hypothetical protein